MKNLKIFTLLSIFSLFLGLNASLAQTPSLLEFEQGFYIAGVNDSGLVLGNKVFGVGQSAPGIWDTKTGTYTQLSPASGGMASSGSDINNAGQVVGQTRLPSPQNSVATFWGGGSGAGISLGATNAPLNKGGSAARAISNSGIIVGETSHCMGGDLNKCYGGYPAIGNPFGLLGIPPVDNNSPRGYAVDVNDSGHAVGSPQKLYIGGSETELGFNPRVILNDGTIIGSKFRSSGVVKRLPNGDIIEIICGSEVESANENGDILTYVGGDDGLMIWHQEKCYRVSDLLPDGVFGWNFPSGNAKMNGLGQIAANAESPDFPVESASDKVAVFLTPKYPFAIEVSSTPTGTPGEFEFEAKVIRGTPSSAVTWDFGDGTAPQASGLKIKKKYTKPGTYTATATVTESNGSGLKSTSTKVVVVPAPTLVLGIVIPGYDTNEVPLGDKPTIEIHVTALDDGVGELRNLSFQGGTFTASNSNVLSYTTASTSPFSLMPGKGNVYPTNVLASQFGEVRLESLIIGEDVTGKPVSANHSRTVRVLDAESILGVDIGAADNSGKVPVTLTNGTGSEVSGRMRFIKPSKKSAALAALILEAKKKNKKKDKNKTKDKTVSYSKYVNYSVGANSDKTYKLKLSKPALTSVKNGKSVKASLQVESTGVSSEDKIRTINATLKKIKSSKKKNKNKKK